MRRPITAALALVAACITGGVANAAETQASRFAIGFHSIDAPVGVRYWVSDAIGADLGVGFTSQTNPGAEAPSLTLHSITVEAGLPWAIRTWERASLLVRPGFQYKHYDDYTIDFFTDELIKFKNTELMATAELEAEIFLAPRVSVSASNGFSYRHITSNLSGTEPQKIFKLIGSDFSTLGFHVYLGH